VHRTQIHIPAPLGNVVRVADAVSRLRLLAADITLLCHFKLPEKIRSCEAKIDFTGLLMFSATSAGLGSGLNSLTTKDTKYHEGQK
jgi:hypothetical protein